MTRALRVGVVLIDRDGQVLQQQRDGKAGIPYPGRWSIPGGAVHAGENVEAAARREILEETGYRVGDLRPLLIEDHCLPDDTPVRRVIFWSRYDSIQEIRCYEGQEVQFVAPRELAFLPLSPGHGAIIDAARGGRAGAGERHWD